MIEVTQAAEDFLADLMRKQDAAHLGIQVEVLDGGSPHAQISMSFLEPALADASYTTLATRNPDLRLFTRTANSAWLEGGKMDFRENDTGGTIVVDAPHLHVPQISEDSPVEDRINHVLMSEVNPGLRAHGGRVSLVDLVDGSVAILQFGGGCQGCGMVDVTLKQGVERTLLEKIPELTAVRDVTDHSQRENAYYR